MFSIIPVGFFYQIHISKVVLNLISKAVLDNFINCLRCPHLNIWFIFTVLNLIIFDLIQMLALAFAL